MDYYGLNDFQHINTATSLRKHLEAAADALWKDGYGFKAARVENLLAALPSGRLGKESISIVVASVCRFIGEEKTN